MATFTGEDLDHEADKVELKKSGETLPSIPTAAAPRSLVLPKRQQRLTHIATNTGRDSHRNLEH